MTYIRRTELELEDKITSNIDTLKGIDGALPVTFGVYGTSHNRYLTGVTGTHPGTDTGHTATWTTLQNIKNLRIIALGVTGGSILNGDGFRVVINAPDATTAANWLSNTNPLLDEDVIFEVGIVAQELFISRTDPIERIDFEAIGGGTLNTIFIGASSNL